MLLKKEGSSVALVFIKFWFAERVTYALDLSIRYFDKNSNLIRSVERTLIQKNFHHVVLVEHRNWQSFYRHSRPTWLTLVMNDEWIVDCERGNVAFEACIL